MESRLGFLCGVDIRDLLARHEALLVVNCGINTTIPARMDPLVVYSENSLLSEMLVYIGWKLVSCGTGSNQTKLTRDELSTYGGHVLTLKIHLNCALHISTSALCLAVKQ